MKSPNAGNEANTQDSRWPISAMLMFGTFGTGTPAEKRFLLGARIMSAAWLGWLIVWALGG